MNKKTVSNILLLLTALIWGSAFVAQKAGTVLEPMTYNGIRTLVGACSLLPVIAILSRKKDPAQEGRNRANPHAGEKASRKPSQQERPDGQDAGQIRRNTILGGILCGVLLFTASTLQQFGMYFDTDAGVAGFITALYIVLVPILGLLIGRRARPLVWLCVLIGAIGFYLLTMAGGDSGFRLSKGYIFLLLCALSFSCHILAIDRFSPKADGVRLSCIQFFTCGLISIVGMFLFEHPALPDILACWFPIVYGGVFSCGIAYTLQIIAQKNADPAAASLILSLESVFSVLAGALLLGERMTALQILGCAVIFTAVIIAQLPDKKVRN